MSSSDTPSRCLMSARKLFPWAATSTRLPVRTAGAMESFQNGTTRSTVSFRSEEHTSELQSLMRISYAVFCLKKKITIHRSAYTYLIQRQDLNEHNTLSSY